MVALARLRTFWRHVPRALPAAIAVAAVLAFMAAAALRRLNFDEALALRAGWLLVAEVDAAPPFAMPFTALLGLLGHAVSDPGTVFLLARLTVVTAVVAALLAAFRGAGGGWAVTALAMVLTLSQATFFVHGLEFRYDAAITLGLLLAVPRLVAGRPRDLTIVAALAALVAAHHLKGVVVGGLLLALGVARGGVRAVPRLLLGAAATGGAVAAVAAAAGWLGQVRSLYGGFFALARDATRWYAPWQTLGPTVARDATWWALAALAVAGTIASWRGMPLSAGRRLPELWVLLVAGVALAPVLLHPHPWAYMLAPPAPFLGWLAARLWHALPPRRRWAIASVAAALVVGQGVVGPPPFGAHLASFRAPRSSEVAELRWLRAAALPGETVIDPSGLAYFLRPCTREWYIDSLFSERAANGAWMQDLATADPSACPWLLRTYRLDMLPWQVKQRLSNQYRLVTDGIALWAGDPRGATLPAGDVTSPTPFNSFW